jgi:hypothetical protein
MLVSVRPPWPHTKDVMDKFTWTTEGWEQATGAHGEDGVANLLQAEMYDECVSHGVRYFVATTLKWWVFGVFTPDYSRCEVSPKIRRDETDCTVLQSLVTWMRRALEAEEDAYSTQRKEERRDPHLYQHDARPAVQRIPRRRNRATSSTRAAPAESVGEPSKQQSMPQLAEVRQRRRSTSFSRRRSTELRDEDEQKKRDRRRERERAERARHTFAAHVPFQPPPQAVPVQYVPVVPAPYYYPQQWF